MTRHLVMFTPRTGSTFLSEVIAHQYGFHQYGESWHMPWHGKYKLINDISMLAQREYFIDSFLIVVPGMGLLFIFVIPVTEYLRNIIFLLKI